MRETRTGNSVLVGRKIHNKTSNKLMIQKRRDMRRKLLILLAVLTALLVGFIGGSVVTANAKTQQELSEHVTVETTKKESEENTIRYKYYTTVYITRNMTLWDIAEEYISEEYSDKRAYIDEVMEINQLTNDKLSYGSTICVPYYSDEYK